MKYCKFAHFTELLLLSKACFLSASYMHFCCNLTGGDNHNNLVIILWSGYNIIMSAKLFLYGEKNLHHGLWWQQCFAFPMVWKTITITWQEVYQEPWWMPHCWSECCIITWCKTWENLTENWSKFLCNVWFWSYISDPQCTVHNISERQTDRYSM